MRYTAAEYVVYIHGFNVPGTSPFKLYSWVLGSTNAGNMTVTAPSAATLGASGTINLTFTGLAPGTKYLGSVAYSGTSSLPNPTLVRVDPKGCAELVYMRPAFSPAFFSPARALATLPA